MRSLAPGWRDALAAALAEVPPAPPALAPGLAALRRGDLADAVLALAGRGEGLTPAGDDILAGYAAWRHAEGRPVALTGAPAPPRRAARPRRAHPRALLSPRASRISAARSAGSSPSPLMRCSARCGPGTSSAARRRAKGLAAWGSSSGAAILWGMAAAA